MRYPYYIQHDLMDCGPTCLRMISKFYGKRYSLQFLRGLSSINKAGVSLLGLSQAAEKIGFQTQGVRISFEQLKEIPLPCIVHWQQKHFVVVYEIKKNEKVLIADPVIGLITHSKDDFVDSWIGKDEGRQKGLSLVMKPTPLFYEQEDDKIVKSNFSFFFRYLYLYRRLVIQLLVGLGVGSLLQLILPFLTQSIVDVGINTRNLNFIYVILIAQIMLFIGRTSVDFIRSWILLHISTRINISILTDFLIKLMKLPVSFFDTKMTGDILQRMNDQKRIESFLTGSTLNTVFSMFNFVIFGAVLAFYDYTIFIVFAVSSILYGIWIVLFLRRRRELDFKRFDISAKNQSLVVQLISGMQEIKLNNCEQQKRWEWERLQTGLFRFSVKSLSLGQIQQAGSSFINEGKNILITFIVAKAVIEGQLTLGAMMAIQYVVGQLNSPIEQLVGFIQQLQDAKISIERLNEIHAMDDEEPLGIEFIHELPFEKGISLSKLNFSYPSAANENVLTDINIYIPEGKTTAIVGMSGSGKTTILKLLLRFYSPSNGELRVGNMPLENISFKMWRSLCGVVMQDGFIFSDTIAKNIAVGDEYPDVTKLQNAVMVANISDFIEGLPMGLNTKIGPEGNGISQGQRQRILIARAVYKNPEYIFFDEATNALDANNEKVIMENLETFFKGRTVVVVAHRLSTVKNADNIIVLEKGRVIEQGTHAELTQNRGDYFRLVQNQLELGA
ncbi:peptidase domain-containing ABC transporter [Pedobacter sp. R20-19]|uniref:peptidase domain-containing ABC transporter n=1 Tax=Pedobacter sp. R20-19 TaxID=1270196 RepID=UPI00049350BD|nr:peptidase domain-containing ABC transporter [Pedobacter sp. R20-19]